MLENGVILVVDSVEWNRKAMRTILGEEYEVLEAADVEEALEILGKRRVDIVISGIGMTGAGTPGRMREECTLRDIPVLAVAAETGRETPECGADGVIFPPYESADVRYRVKSLLLRQAVQEKENAHGEREGRIRRLSGEIMRESRALLDCCGSGLDEESRREVDSHASRILALAEAVKEVSPGCAPAGMWSLQNRFHGGDGPDGRFGLDSLRVFLLDDNELTRSYHVSMLLRLGVWCDYASNRVDALQEMKRARRAGDGYDICFVSWNMPGVTRTVQEIRGCCARGEPYIVGTTGEREAAEAELLAAGVDYILEKPVYQAALYRFLTGICGRILQEKRPADVSHRDAGS